MWKIQKHGFFGYGHWCTTGTKLTFCRTPCMLLLASREMACFHWLTHGGNRSECSHFQHIDPGFLLDTCKNETATFTLSLERSTALSTKILPLSLIFFFFFILTWAACDGPVDAGVASCRHWRQSPFCQSYHLLQMKQNKIFIRHVSHVSSWFT